MNGRLKWLGVVVLLAVAPLWFSGCASTSTRESTGEYIDDSAITAKVKTACAKDHDVSAMQVNVETYKGVVQLSGFVDTDQAKQRAMELAQRVNGVVRVENNLIVKPVNSPEESMNGKLEEYEGDIAAVDAEKGTVTVKKALISHTFELGAGAQISLVDGKRAAVGDLHVGDHVKVTYSEQAGVKKIAKIEQLAEK